MRPTLWIALLAALAGCPQPGPTETTDAAAGVPSPPSATEAPTAPPTAARPHVATHEGGAVARSADEKTLYVADEDHDVLRVLSLPLDAQRPAVAVAMPGPPANVLALADRVLVTIRSPGLLLVLRPDAAAGLVETARVPLPRDAWGLAVTPDETLALVTSAWTHQLSAVDLASGTKRWSLPLRREPRGVVVRPDGASAYVSHLVGANVTRVDSLAASPVAHPVALPAAPLRAPSGVALDASLGYSLALSDDGSRLFAPRHALGAMGRNAWFGAATVDVLLTATDTPLAPLHQARLPALKSALAAQVQQSGSTVALPGGSLAPFTQPRAVVLRKSTHSLLVAGEGDDLVTELDALSVDPTLSVLRTYKLGAGYDPNLPVASTCGAPAGLALSADETTAWVLCRSTYDVAVLHLETPGTPYAAAAPIPTVRLAEDPLGPEVSTGRRLFYNATDPIASGGLACAGCHPEGRDDGHVWHQATFTTADGQSTNFLGTMEDIPDEAHTKGVPRRTPMLAGRVDAAGPYGWHGESPDLPSRIKVSFGLHRWGAIPKHEEANLDARAGLLVAFLRKGLVPPRGEAAELTAEEKRGQAIFLGEEAHCSKCHVPQPEFSDRMAYPFKKLPPVPGFDDEAVQEFKTPSLRFVGERAPYFHDGRAGSLEQLLSQNGDRMGKTSQLSADDRAALAAFLRTL
jgi:hypothetical protein